MPMAHVEHITIVYFDPETQRVGFNPYIPERVLFEHTTPQSTLYVDNEGKVYRIKFYDLISRVAFAISERSL